ncbi:MAG: fumarylacetoacetate hydrolase family protein [Alphaproteobacteria bacterium]|nr:fumarylacetoacetate hydrolase family protein [Alphaproteobacteria bacterium]
MKLISYRYGDLVSYGGVVDGEVRDVGKLFGEEMPTLRAALAAGGLEDVVVAAENATPECSVDDITFLPPIPDPAKIILVGLNYTLHVQETGRSDSDYPVLFTRFANTQVGHGEPMVKPTVSDAFDYEGELALVIGKRGRHIAEADALDYIAGYSCYNDGSIRDWQRHTHQFTPGKNFPATGGFGPWMVTTDEIPDPTTLTLVTRLNGEEMQRATTDMLIFTIPYIVHYISTFTELEPGDVIATGTPGGVGFKRTPPVFMKPGDTVEVDISGVGVLSNPIIAE